jgi:PhnO protein
MQSQIAIRQASEADLKIVYNMMCLLEEEELPLKNFRSIFLDNLTASQIGYFLAEVEGKPVGFISCHIQALLHHTALIAEIQEMFVYAEYRSQAVGKTLLEKAIRFASSKGAMQVEVTSRASRQAAHRFYEREGFLKSHVKLVKHLGEM